MKSKTPVIDFVKDYKKGDHVRLHMPGHKGVHLLGMESLDITEIDGADSLYEAEGIIRESEKIAGEIFGAETFYSTEGSSLCIRAMLYLTVLWAKEQGRKPLIAAGRNVHKTFLTAAALLDFEISWLWPSEEETYLSCRITPEELEKCFAEELPAAVYVTSPDYLGHTADIKALARVCHAHDVLLLVDNAHGAYLKFLEPSRHPMDAGADLCCDSAHKTLPALTGAAYLHVAKNAPDFLKKEAKAAMAMFGSTSPSYLILESLDGVNACLKDGYKERLSAFVGKMVKLKETLQDSRYVLCGDEPTKLTIDAKKRGYTGEDLAQILLAHNVVCEFRDRDYLVLMLTPENTDAELQRLEEVLLGIPAREEIPELPPKMGRPEKVLSVREAAMARRESLPAEKCLGRIMAGMHLSCPPAVPIAVCGERIDGTVMKCLAYYGKKECTVVKEE